MSVPATAASVLAHSVVLPLGAGLGARGARGRALPEGRGPRAVPRLLVSPEQQPREKFGSGSTLRVLPLPAATCAAGARCVGLPGAGCPEVGRQGWMGCQGVAGCPAGLSGSGCAKTCENYCAKSRNVRMGWEGRGTHDGSIPRAGARQPGSCGHPMRENKKEEQGAALVVPRRGLHREVWRKPPACRRAEPSQTGATAPAPPEPPWARRTAPATCRGPPPPRRPLSAPGRGQAAEWQSGRSMDQREAAGREESPRSDSADGQWSSEKRRGGRSFCGMTVHGPNGKARSGGAGQRGRQDQWPRRPRPVGARGVATPPGAEGATGAARAAPAPGERRRPAPPVPSPPFLSSPVTSLTLPFHSLPAGSPHARRAVAALPRPVWPGPAASPPGAKLPRRPLQPNPEFSWPRPAPFPRWIPTATPLPGAGFPWRRRPPPPAPVPPSRC